MKSKFFLLVLFLIISIQVNAAKVKSSKSYLNKLDTTIIPLTKNIESLKSILNGLNASQSFVTTDFWGLKPHWYVKGGRSEIISAEYPYSNEWINGYGIWNRHKSTLVRNINGVIFSPVKLLGYSSSRKNGWYETLNISFDFSPGYTSSDHYQRYVKKYLLSSGVPSSQISNALNYFQSKYTPGTELIEKKIYNRLDRLYPGIRAKNGYVKVYQNLAEKLDRKNKLDVDSWIQPSKHFNIYTEELFQKYNVNLNVQSKKKLNGLFESTYNRQSIFSYYMNNYKLRVEVPLQHFQIAKGMSKSKRYNQLQKIKTLLDKKVASGKVKAYKESKYTIYEDSFDKYTRGRIAIDFDSGMGYWQLPIWEDRRYVQYYFSKINTDVKNVNTVLAKYLSICLDETVSKFTNKSSQTSDF